MAYKTKDDSDVLKIFGNNIRSARQKRRLTIRQLAKSANCSRDGLSLIENGERKPVNDKTGHIIQFTTGSDGKGTATIALDYETTGQKLYFDQQYCLVESKAPEGYVVNSDNAYYFTLVAPANGDSNYSYDSDSNVYPNGYVLSVSNRSFLAMLLPSTGGMGTNMMYLAGFIMILLGSTFILFKKYKKG